MRVRVWLCGPRMCDVAAFMIQGRIWSVINVFQCHLGGHKIMSLVLLTSIPSTTVHTHVHDRRVGR